MKVKRNASVLSKAIRILGLSGGNLVTVSQAVADYFGRPAPLTRQRKWEIVNALVYPPGGPVAVVPTRIKAKARKHTRPYTPVSAPVSSVEFLSSYAWRKLRMQAIIRDGRRCACCGRTPDQGITINVDHIQPRRTHPELALDLDNLQVLCHDCNHGKGNWDSTDWRDSRQIWEV